MQVHDIGEKLDLSGITYAEGAGDTEKECLEGTRTEILSEIIDWVNSTGDDVSRVLWLLALGGLGSCYSFDREREVDHRHEKIFSTTARSQAERDPKLRQELVDAVQRPNVRQV